MASNLPLRPIDVQIKRLGEKLRALRETRGISLQELARVVGLKSHSYLSDLERGEKPAPPSDLVLKLALFYNVSTDVLLKDELDLPKNALNPSSE